MADPRTFLKEIMEDLSSHSRPATKEAVLSTFLRELFRPENKAVSQAIIDEFCADQSIEAKAIRARFKQQSN